MHQYDAAKKHILKVLYYTTRPLSYSNALCIVGIDPSSFGDFKETIKHLITYYHDRENEKKKKKKKRTTLY